MSSPVLELPSKTRLRMRIKRLTVVGEWKWIDGKGNDCGICLAPFEKCCTDCRFPGEECPMAVGVCNHPFHKHCIEKWINSCPSEEASVCPLCRQEWKFNK